MHELSLLHYIGLFCLALSAGTIDAVAGGGGLLSVPGLLALGLPPVSALATNKAQAIFSSLSATIHFIRKGRLRLRDHLVAAPAALIGAIFGAAAIAHLPGEILRVLVPTLLIGIALWLALGPRQDDVPRRALVAPLLVAATLVPLIGAYDGFFGPGTGTFLAVGLVWLNGLPLQEATMRAKLYNFMSNLGALLFFVWGGHIVWDVAGVMALGTVIGGQLGARMVLRHGSKLIRPLLALVSIAVSLKLLWEQLS